MNYEWDENKNSKNQAKHGIDFLDAIHLFRDHDRIELVDQRKDYGEVRYRVIGVVEEIVIYVVYTYREQNCRLISARRASRDEREAYYNQKLG